MPYYGLCESLAILFNVKSCELEEKTVLKTPHTETVFRLFKVFLLNFTTYVCKLFVDFLLKVRIALVLEVILEAFGFLTWHFRRHSLQYWGP
jgi:hypothetical protein